MTLVMENLCVEKSASGTFGGGGGKASMGGAVAPPPPLSPCGYVPAVSL